MSTTAYQTTAKPRGRKDLEQVDSDLSSSRASSQASIRLAKTVSRGLEDFQSPSKSRPGSPFFWHKNRAIDPAVLRDSSSVSIQAAASDDLNGRTRPVSASFMRTSQDDPLIPGAFPNTSESQPSTMGASNTLSRVVSQSMPGTRRSTSTSRTRSLNQSSISRMQPTVVDASDDETGKALTTARSSAASLELKSPQTSDLGVKPEKPPTPPPPPTHTPPKPPAVPDTQSAAKDNTWPAPPGSDTSRRGSLRSGSRPSYLVTSKPSYNAPPSSFPTASPYPHPADGGPRSDHGSPFPTGSPAQSPTMMHAPTFSALPGPGYPYGYPPQAGSAQFPPPAYYSDSQHLSSPPLSSKYQEPRNAGAQEDTQDWSKLTRVLPELNRLLSKYEAQKGQPSAEGSFASQLDHHRTHEIASLRVELEANKSEYEKVIQKLIAESFALKRQVEDRDKDVHSMQAAVTDLRTRQEKHNVAEAERGEANTRQMRLQEEHDGLAVKLERTVSELQEVKTSRDHIRKQHEEIYNELNYYKNEASNWKSKYQGAIDASDQARLAKEDLVSAKMQLESQVDELRRKAQAREEKHHAEMKALRKDYEVLLDTKDKERSILSGDHKAAIGSVQLELAGLIDRHSRQKKDLESSKTHAFNLEKKLESKTKEREEQSIRHRQQMEAKTKEIDDLAASHRRQLEAQLASLTAQREKDIENLKHDHEKAVQSTRKEHDTRSKRMREDHAAELRSKQADLDKQKSAYDAVLRDTQNLRATHEQLTVAMVSWKKRQEEWQAEQKKISEIMEGSVLLESRRRIPVMRYPIPLYEL
ncbi:uncharacterized protein AB675_2653 [Cyphellophora attinorum]|uniref:Uncharacterized protein n=1 Tax=Cyphellophora attinorum TaxID=1664694 RepID=A0A0N1HGJ3_9EURO|nr:uncharacterized protein AB675_2653 [Phialophora attinorum]KPI45320.1 hypothetical protein AB675_2653 [Phialophora attinorum]